MNCPLYKQYKNAKTRYLKDLDRGHKRLEQQRSLWIFIVWVLKDTDEKNKYYWVVRLYEYFEKRFYDILELNWIELLGQMNDRQAYGRYSQQKAREYCLLIRDAAACISERMKEYESRDQAGIRAL